MHVPDAVTVFWLFWPRLRLFPPVFFGVLFRLTMVRCGREGRREWVGAVGEKGEM